MASKFDSNIHKKKALYFYYGALVRLLLSILKDADIYDSSNYYRKQKDKVYCQKELDMIWEHMDTNIKNLYDEFNNSPDKSGLHIVRTELSNELYGLAQKHSKGAYKLSMPVGAGKTYSALRYAIENAKKFNKWISYTNVGQLNSEQ